MKKIISITISLCLIFGAIMPVYADAWTSSQAQSVTSDVDNIELHTRNVYQYLRDFLLSYNSGQTSNWTFGDLYWEIKRIGSWIAPIGTNDGDYETLWSTLLNIAIDTRSYLPSVPNIASYVSNWMVSNNNYLNSILNTIENNVPAYTPGSPVWTNWVELRQNGHQQLFKGSNFQTIGRGLYYLPTVSIGNNTPEGQTIYWNYGTPISNIALILQRMMINQSAIYKYRWDADLTHYNDQLSTWDSQGETLDQVLFTPESAIQGLYRYLAYKQRDVARLTYVLASDEEIEAREKARDNQNAVLDNFIDPDGEGAVNDTNIGNIANASGSIKDNFNTGVNPSGIFSIFSTDDKATPWFSNETKNELMPQTRAGYSTPLLDAYYEEIMGVFDNAR